MQPKGDLLIARQFIRAEQHSGWRINVVPLRIVETHEPIQRVMALQHDIGRNASPFLLTVDPVLANKPVQAIVQINYIQNFGGWA